MLLKTRSHAATSPLLSTALPPRETVKKYRRGSATQTVSGDPGGREDDGAECRIGRDDLRVSRLGGVDIDHSLLWTSYFIFLLLLFFVFRRVPGGYDADLESPGLYVDYAQFSRVGPERAVLE